MFANLTNLLRRNFCLSGVTFLLVALISVAVGDLLHMTRRHRHRLVDEHVIVEEHHD